jgi:hypothetical protein
MKSPLTRNSAGQVAWTHQEGDAYLVTGTLVNGGKFRIRTTSWRHAAGINLWRGTRWLLRGGKRFKINSVIN